MTSLEFAARSCGLQPQESVLARVAGAARRRQHTRSTTRSGMRAPVAGRAAPPRQTTR